jgi:hypothetical protein
LLSRAVRSHNVPRISKSYESFGDRFTTTVVDDIATSGLSEAVKGLYRVATVSYLRKLNVCQVLMSSCMSRPLSPIHPTLKPSSTCVVSAPRFKFICCLTCKKLFAGCRLRYHAHPRCRPRRRREESHYHSKHSVTRRTERFLERDNHQREM